MNGRADVKLCIFKSFPYVSLGLKLKRLRDALKIMILQLAFCTFGCAVCTFEFVIIQNECEWTFPFFRISRSSSLDNYLSAENVHFG